MEDNKSQKHHVAKKRYTTLFGKLLNTIFMILLTSLVAWLLLIIWFSLHVYLTNISATNAYIQQLIQYDLSKLVSYKSINDVVRWFKSIEENSQQIFNYVFQSANNALNKINSAELSVNHSLSEIIINILLGSIEIVVARVSLFGLMVPFFICVLFVLSVDGLVLRDKRKFQGARESTFFFHRIKPMAGKLFYLGFLLYLCVPLNFAPLLILVPIIFVMGWFTNLSLKNFKKYV
ncbi:MAG: DUF4400 domain-containing protein [Gammaproteobacteria bacterium]